MMRICATGVAIACAASALATENIINYNTPGGTFNYDEGTTINKPGVHQRILVQSGTVNINTGAYVKAGGDATGECNYVGVDNSGPAYLNINGGTVWCATDGGGAGHLGIGINNCAQPATVTLNSGLLRVDAQVRSATWWNSCNGTSSSGALVVNGGEAYVGQFVIGAHTASTGTSELTLNGGSLTVEELLFLQYNGQVFTWGNGTLVAARDNIFVVNAYTSQNNMTRRMEITGTPATFNTGGFAQVLPAFTGTGGLTVTGTGGSIAVSGSQAFTGDLTLSNGTALVVTDSATFAGRVVLGGANAEIRFDTANTHEEVITLSAAGYSVPSGDILDYVELTDSSSYTKSISDNTITVTRNAPVAAWTGTANDGSPANAANWCVTQGETVLGNTLPDGNTVVVMQGQNVNMQLPSGSTLACKSFEIRDCTFTADCDWRGLSVTPVIIGTANLDGHVLKLNNLSAVSGSAFSGGDGSFVEFVVDESATIANLYEYTYIENIDNLTFSGSAKILLRKADGDGTLTVTRLELGNQLNGDMVQTNGTVNLGNKVNAIGENSGKTSTYTMTGGSINVAGGSEFIVGSYGTGVFNQSGGSVTLNEWFSLGRHGGNGTYTMTGGSLTANHTGNPLWIGGDSPGTGTLTIDSGATVTFKGGIDNGRYNGATGHIILNGGTMNVKGGSGFNIGRDGTGTLVQNGGTLTANEGGTSGNLDNVWRIAWGGTGTGSYTLNDGTAIAKSPVYIGDGGTATYVQTGGTMTAESGLTFAVGANSKTTFTLSGGVLNTKSINKGSGTLNGVTFDGGTIVATNVTNGANFITGLNNVKYGPGGLTLDTAGYDVTMATASGANVLASAGSTFTKAGSGTLTVAAVPPVGNMAVSSGTLALSASCDNASMLAHRWSFASDLTDSVTGTAGTMSGSGATYADGVVKLPGGNKGTCYIDLGANKLPSDSVTIEAWFTLRSQVDWTRVFVIGGSIVFNSRRADNGNACNFDSFNGTQIVNTSGKVLAKDTPYYVAITFTPDGNGGVIEKQYVKKVGDSGFIWNNTVTKANWSVTANAAQGYFWLGHSNGNDKDTNIDFDEVRVWSGALDDTAIALSVEKGVDATAAEIAEIAAATSAASPAVRTLKIESGATLSLGAGNTLVQPVVICSGTVSGGTLKVANELHVKNLGDCLFVNGGTFDIDGATVVFDDLTPLASASKSYTLVKAVNGGTITGSPLQPATDAQLPTGWHVKTTSGSVTLRKDGCAIFIR